MSPRTRTCTETELLPDVFDGFSYREGSNMITATVAIKNPPKVVHKTMASGDIMSGIVLPPRNGQGSQLR